MTDAACRYEGEELATILTESSGDGAMVFAERLRSALESIEQRPKGKPVVVTASLGVIDAATLGEASQVSVQGLLAGGCGALTPRRRWPRSRVPALPVGTQAT